MSDFTIDNAAPTHICTWMDMLFGRATRVMASVGAPASTNSNANTATYIPLVIPSPYLVNRAFWVNGNTITSGHCDIGIYTEAGTRLWSAGSTAQSGTNALQYVTVSGGLLLTPGRYYLAVVCDSSTGHMTGAIVNPGSGFAGLLMQISAFPLPATATFVIVTSSQIYPLAGITNTPSGF